MTHFPLNASASRPDDAAEAPGASAHGVWRASFEDVDEHAAALGSLYPQHYDQLGAGRFEGELTRIEFDGVVLLRERVGRRVMQAGTIRQPTITWVRDSAGPYRCNGFDLASQSAMFMAEGQEFEVQCSPSELIALTLTPQAPPEGIGDCAESPYAGRERGPRALPAPLASWLRRSVSRALRLAPGADERARAALRDELLAVVAAVADLPGSGRGQPRRRDRTYERVVRAARRIAESDLARPPTIEELCRRVGVSRRNLFYAFDELIGITPHEYLHTLRLNAARRAIKQRALAGAAIGDIAAAWGFLSPSHFAGDYKRRFGERPSDTAKRAAICTFPLTTGRPRP